MFQIIKQRKDVDKMSFVGMHNTEQGIIAFADSKASIVYRDGYVEEDKQRHITKIFHNNAFIFVTHGNNEFFNRANKIYLETYVKEHLKENMDYETFFSQLYQLLLLDRPSYNDGIYHFIIGSRDEKGLFIRELTIDLANETMKYSPKSHDYSVLYGGQEEYVQMYKHVPTYYDVDANEYASLIKQQVERLISIFDLDYKYNSVGAPVETYVFQDYNKS